MPNVAPGSNTGTYVAMQLEIDNWRWAGVPFCLRMGKYMSQRNTEIAIRFKRAPYAAFQDTPVDTLRPNWLVLRISPDEGISLQFEVERRGPVVDLAAVKMDFHYSDWFPKEPNAGYETLPPYVPLEERTVGFRPTIVEDFGSALEAVAKIVGVSSNFDVLEQCEHNVRAALDDGAFVARSQPYYLDITHPLANKGAALSEIAKLLGIPLTEIAVIGDGGNDVAMFERAGLSIAMGNASSEVQREADLVTDSNRDDGFANAIKRFILSDGRSQARVEPGKAGDRAW